jgi:hypothetical protein
MMYNSVTNILELNNLTINRTRRRGDGQGWCERHFNSCVRWEAQGQGMQMLDELNRQLQNNYGKCGEGRQRARGRLANNYYRY